MPTDPRDLVLDFFDQLRAASMPPREELATLERELAGESEPTEFRPLVQDVIASLQTEPPSWKPAAAYPEQDDGLWRDHFMRALDSLDEIDGLLIALRFFMDGYCFNRRRSQTTLALELSHLDNVLRDCIRYCAITLSHPETGSVCLYKAEKQALLHAVVAFLQAELMPRFEVLWAAEKKRQVAAGRVRLED